VKRLHLLGIVMLTMLACGGGTPESGATAGDTTPAQAAAGAAAGGPDFINTIVMTKNNGAYEGASIAPQAPCIGIVIDGRPRHVQRRRRLRWLIQNDVANPCPNLNAQIGSVELHFENKIMSKGIGKTDAELDVLTADAANKWIEGFVHADPAKAPDNPHAKYFVFYMTQKASPDPEIDIMGDCPTCGDQ
jgi:hypothetical protein